ncbi:hypothetical protein BDR07DRAFT_1323501 [Suillus spraguei]|nr:hypothetical protein BDR07DRAFT_1323501 [Suillus spraguei]
MEDGIRSQLTATSRLTLLKERDASWNALKWRETRDIPVLQGDIIWELCGGIFAQSSLPPEGTLRLFRLPSQYRNIQASSWRVPLLKNSREFTIDPAQDLLVLVENPIVIEASDKTHSHIQIQVHLRSVTTGRVHPSVINVISFLNHNLDMRRTPRNEANPEVPMSLQISGDFLGILFISDPGRDNIAPELVVWNWKTGELVLIRSSCEIATFTFLTSRYLLVGTVMNGFTQVTEPRLLILDMSRPSTIKLTLTADYVCVFGFPSFDPVVSPVNIAIRPDPFPEWKLNIEAHIPFSIVHEQQLLLVTMWVELEERKKKVSYDLFVPANILLSCVTTLSRQNSNSRHMINWDTWGSTGTRFLKSPPHSHVWTGYVFGTKFGSLIKPPKTATGQRSQILQVWDFNQLSLKRAVALGFEREHTRFISDATLVRDEVLIEAVRTSLPYSVTTRTLPPSCSPEEPAFTDAMCCEDAILLVNQTNNQRRNLRVLVF